MKDILEQYGKLLRQVDAWFARCMERFPSEIACASGCSECCRGLFDITLLDAAYLKSGFELLSAAARRRVTEKARVRLAGLQQIWPDFVPPYLLNCRPEEEWEELMPDDDETPCVLLGNDGRCLVYDHRPMTCRLHGLPLIDLSGDVMHDEWCTLNFTGTDPLALEELRGEFRTLFREELLLFRECVRTLFGQSCNEIDTFIPTALLIDFRKFDWQSWRAEHRSLFETEKPACASERENLEKGERDSGGERGIDEAL